MFINKLKPVLAVVAALPAFFLAACEHLPSSQVQRYQWDDISDEDQDGVINARDLCADSPEAAIIDELGCADWQPSLAHKEFHIDFDFDSAAIRTDQQWKIDRLAQAMLDMPTSSLQLIGDTSSEGSLEYNRKLAVKRADAIIDALTSKGVDKSRVNEHIFTDSANSLFRPLHERRRRTLGLIIYPGSENNEQRWTVYSTEDSAENN
ncbi:OmpA family protein [Agaribacterium haliotis]|uniref:OmpA family protein n=1 Tax=Agaribacterium haliotis TaxID=2013869 RepID=UPI0013041583|nr:OmpA family protein [Agaribacterium haliotis]